MGNTKKRIAALGLVGAMALSALAGCGEPKIDNGATLLTAGDSKITMGAANFYTRYQQALSEAQYTSLFGDQYWGMQMSQESDVTLEDETKKSIMESLKNVCVLEAHMEDYNVTLTEEEKTKINEATKKLIESNEADDLEMVSGDEENIRRVFELVTIEEKMRRAMIADVDTKVSDEEAAQKTLDYVLFSFTKTAEDGTTSNMTDDEKAVLKLTAEDFLKKAKDQKDLKAYAEEAGYSAGTISFDSETTNPAEALIEQADKLKEGEFTGVVEADNGYYIAKVTSTFDREATDAEKEAIVEERQNTRFTELLDGLREETKVEVNEKEWDKISFKKQRVSVKQAEKEE